jgi:hypothetical protein
MNLLEYKKRVFRERVADAMEIPSELKSKITKSLLQDETTYIVPEKVKTDNKEKLQIVDEVHMILNELEVFERENRKRKQMYLLEKIAEQIDEDFISTEELTDFVFFGDKLCNIEKRHLEREKHKGSGAFNKNLVVRINKILEDDDKGLNRIKRKWLSLKRHKCSVCKTHCAWKVYKCYECKKHFHRKCNSYKSIGKTGGTKRRTCYICYKLF